MAIKGHLETNIPGGAPLDSRANERRSLLLETSGLLPGGLEANVRIHNISAAGLLLETDLPLTEGERLALELPQTGAVTAIVVWQSEHLFGCAFEEALGPGALAAAQLRGDTPAQSGVERPKPFLSQSDSLGIRINRLRRERGLTLANVASALGVSKPTVWAWEKGKARPLPDRIGPIAEVLGVEVEALQGSHEEQPHTALIEDCRVRIATACGTQPSKVRIMIEL